MTKKHETAEPAMFDAETTKELVELLNQSLADSLDLAYQTKQAHWNAKGPDFYSLHLLSDVLHGQLVRFVDEFAERAMALGGHALGTIRAAGSLTHLPEYPLNAVKCKAHLDALVDRFGKYAVRLRKGVRKAEQLGDRGTADLLAEACYAADKALWMLKAQLEA